ncbi:ribosome maturation factor RimP [Brochothrix campestris]|uniref:Ribosome maturation factor RimP n=1 Tax=Brochothrix campestris FSL F6-1037 TaxID=1265861 RepID=W7CWK1_9LIST|nr:ribosome maturation factor RimP [Brochothrix campestris]EUJ41125.1 ribosome maturation protein RimP [Brochothrix campestris FSL F6-1037]
MSKITEQITAIAEPIVEGLNVELVDIEFLKEGANWFLRIYVDTEAGIDISECAAVSREISAKLDELDPIEQNYFLEVSSPGAERPLKKKRDFERAIGQFINVKLYEPFEDSKEHEGTLKAYDGESITVTIADKDLTFDIKKIAMVRLAIQF